MADTSRNDSIYHPRPYSGAQDLARMMALNSKSIAAAGGCGYLHPGDVAHRLSNGMRREQNPGQVVQLWESTAGSLAGYHIIYRRWGDFDLQVHHAHRGRPLEAAMIAHVSQQIRTLCPPDNDHDGSAGTDVDEGDETRAALLEAAGYQRETADPFVCTLRELADPLPPPELPAGFSIRSAAGEDDAAQLAAVHSAAFNSNWEAEEYVRVVMRAPGYEASRELVVVAPDGRFAAFCILWYDLPNRTGLFEPVGTHSAFQRQGLGRALMLAGMQRMQAAGLDKALVTYETTNPASRGLYTSLGFRPLYPVHRYRLPL